MIQRNLAIALAFATLTGCQGPKNEQERLVAQARSVQHLPVKRAEFMAFLGLEGLPSRRFGGSIRSGRMIFMESWNHGAGLTVKAWDSEYVRDIAITPTPIDHVLNTHGIESAHIIGEASLAPARESFEEFVVLLGDKVLYRSGPQETEQGSRRDGDKPTN
jgi:hypothetical protein